MAGEDSSRVCKTGTPGGFGWLCLARSVLALVVTVIAAFVLVHGMTLVLNLDTSTIELDVAQSDVFVNRYSTNTYVFRFYLEANNPSEVLFISYRNITVQLWKDDHKFAEFDLDPSSLSLSQKEEQEYFTSVLVFAPAVNTSYADQNLFKEGKIDGAAMVLSGWLSVLDVQRGGGAATSYEPTNSCASR